MGKQEHNVNDNVDLKGNNNVNDNDRGGYNE